MEQHEVIESQIEPTLWDNRIIVVNKRSKIKIFIDPKNLNKGILREHFSVKRVVNAKEKVSGTKSFTKLDAVSRS